MLFAFCENWELTILAQSDTVAVLGLIVVGNLSLLQRCSPR